MIALLSKRKDKNRTGHRIKPMLAYAIDEPFDDKAWLFEIKWDGFRALAEVSKEKVDLYSRTFHSFNHQFPTIVEALQQLQMKVVLDGEIVVLDAKGISNFQSIQNYQKTGKGDLRYYVFDLLYLDGRDLRLMPLIERKALLKSLLPFSKTSVIQFSDHVQGRGVYFFKAAKKQHLEGIMAKLAESPYISKRSRSWLKIKTRGRQEAVICGFTAPKGSRKEFGALLLGINAGKRWQYIGHVGGGFDHRTLVEIKRQLQPLITSNCPYDLIPETNGPVTWVKPKLVCEVAFAEWTQDNQLRQPTFIGMRVDKNPKDVKKETL